MQPRFLSSILKFRKRTQSAHHVDSFSTIQIARGVFAKELSTPYVCRMPSQSGRYILSVQREAGYDFLNSYLPLCAGLGILLSRKNIYNVDHQMPSIQDAVSPEARPLHLFHEPLLSHARARYLSTLLDGSF